MSRKTAVKEKVLALGRGIEKTRIVAFNILFVAVIVVVIIIAFSGGGPEVPKSTALVVAPVGSLVEQLGGDPVEQAKQKLMGGGGLRPCSRISSTPFPLQRRTSGSKLSCSTSIIWVMPA